MEQQLLKKKKITGYEKVEPKVFQKNVKVSETDDTNLIDVLSTYNTYLIAWAGSKELTRLALPQTLRRRGLYLMYIDNKTNIHSEYYMGTSILDEDWKLEDNWREGSNHLVGDLTIGANGNWFINNEDSGFKAQGEAGKSPLLRTSENRLQVSYNNGDFWENVADDYVFTQFRINNNKLEVSTDLGKTWNVSSEYIASWFRWYDNKIQISRDNSNWEDFSGQFSTNIHIERYYNTLLELPTRAPLGTVCAIKDSTWSEDNPVYRIQVYANKGDVLGWVDNGKFVGITGSILDNLGNSMLAAPTQKVFTQHAHISEETDTPAPNGKIKQLKEIEDPAHPEVETPIYPITKVEAVFDNNGQNINDGIYSYITYTKDIKYRDIIELLYLDPEVNDPTHSYSIKNLNTNPSGPRLYIYDGTAKKTIYTVYAKSIYINSINPLYTSDGKNIQGYIKVNWNKVSGTINEITLNNKIIFNLNSNSSIFKEYIIDKARYFNYLIFKRSNEIIKTENTLDFDNIFILPFEYLEGGNYIIFENIKINFNNVSNSEFRVAYIKIRKSSGMYRNIYYTNEDVKYANFSQSLITDTNILILAAWSRYGGGIQYTFLDHVINKDNYSNIKSIEDQILNISKDVIKNVISIKDIIRYQDCLKKLFKSSEQKYSNFTGVDGYWNLENGVAGIVPASNYRYIEELIPVNTGDVIRIYGGKNLIGAAGISVYDNDRKPFDGVRARFNIKQEDIKGDHIEYIAQSNWNLIGLYTSPKNTVENCYATINEGEIIFTEEFINRVNNIIDNKISSLKLESDLSANYYQKGASPKKFSKAPCILVGGQSNADGRNRITEATTEVQNIINNFPISKCHISFDNVLGSFVPFSKDTLTTETGQGNERSWGFDLLVYNQICNIDSKELYVIKRTMGGTAIDHGGADTGWYWTADFEEVLNSGDHSMLRALEDQIKKCIETNSNTFDIRAMLWHQGEGDRLVASKYYKNLKYMIAYIRGVVGNERLPFITGTISHNSVSYNKEIEDAQIRLSQEDPYFYLVDMSGAKLRDPYHFDAEASTYFGKKCYDYLIDAKVISGNKLNPVKPW